MRLMGQLRVALVNNTVFQWEIGEPSAFQDSLFCHKVLSNVTQINTTQGPTRLESPYFDYELIGFLLDEIEETLLSDQERDEGDYYAAPRKTRCVGSWLKARGIHTPPREYIEKHPDSVVLCWLDPPKVIATPDGRVAVAEWGVRFYP